MQVYIHPIPKKDSRPLYRHLIHTFFSELVLTRWPKSTASALKLPSFDAESDDVASRDSKMILGAVNSALCGSAVAVVAVRSGLVRKLSVGRVEAPPCRFVVAAARVLMSFEV